MEPHGTQALDVYVLDVEGGKSVLIMSKTKAQMSASTAATACPIERGMRTLINGCMSLI